MSEDQEAQEDAQGEELRHAEAWKRRAPAAAPSERRGPRPAAEPLLGQACGPEFGSFRAITTHSSRVVPGHLKALTKQAQP